MSKQIDSEVLLVKRIVVKSPFDVPFSADIVKDLLEISHAVSALSADDRMTFSSTLKKSIDDFEKRSLTARVATLCEAYFDTRNQDCLFAAMFFYDLTGKWSDWRDNRIYLAIILHSLSALEEIDKQVVLTSANAFLPIFRKDYFDFLGENVIHTTIKYYGLELVRTPEGYRFRPIDA